VDAPSGAADADADVQPLVHRRTLADAIRLSKKYEEEASVHWAGDEQ
jgi:hypothetical protein